MKDFIFRDGFHTLVKTVQHTVKAIFKSCYAAQRTPTIILYLQQSQKLSQLNTNQWYFVDLSITRIQKVFLKKISIILDTPGCDWRAEKRANALFVGKG